MRPNGEELLRGIQGTLTTYILPEVQTAHAQLELMLVQALLGIAAADWDGAAQRLVDDNAALRELARRGAEALGATPDSSALAGELRSLADEEDPSLRLSDLTADNGRLRDALARLCAAPGAAHAPDIRSAIVGHLRAGAESRTLSLLGPRADG